MRWRCNPINATLFAYKNYAGRGIRVCARWNAATGFAAFASDVGPRPSPRHQLDRIENDGNYEPGNVKWSTKREQALNRRPRPPGLFAGERNSQSRLTSTQVVELRRARVEEGLSFAKLAIRFGIGTSQACRICRGESWQ